MSRTIRRKNANHERRWRVSQIEEIDYWDMVHHGASTPEQCVARQAARFHADNKKTAWGPPFWFRQLYNRKLARANQHELIRCFKLGEWEDHLPPTLMRFTRWDWY